MCAAYGHQQSLAQTEEEQSQTVHNCPRMMALDTVDKLSINALPELIYEQ